MNWDIFKPKIRPRLLSFPLVVSLQKLYHLLRFFCWFLQLFYWDFIVLFGKIQMELFNYFIFWKIKNFKMVLFFISQPHFYTPFGRLYGFLFFHIFHSNQSTNLMGIFHSKNISKNLFLFQLLWFFGFYPLFHFGQVSLFMF